MLGLFTFLVLFSYLIDKVSVDCKFDSKKIEMVRLLHHAITTYGYFGSILFGHHLFHMFYIFMVYAGWVLTKVKYGREYCVITKYVNNVCGVPEETLFHDLMWVLPRPFKELYKGVALYDYYKIISS